MQKLEGAADATGISHAKACNAHAPYSQRTVPQTCLNFQMQYYKNFSVARYACVFVIPPLKINPVFVKQFLVRMMLVN